MKSLIKLLVITFFLLYGNVLNAQKRAMTLEDLKKWNTLAEEQISPNGKFVSFVVAPNDKTDGDLFLYDTKNATTKKFERGFNAKLGFDNNLLIYQIAVQSDTLRKKKLDKVKKDKLPKDSLGIYLFEKDTILKIEKIKKFILPEKNSIWLAYLYEFTEPKKENISQDTLPIEGLEKKEEKKEEKNEKKTKEFKQEGNRLVILNTASLEQFVFDNVQDVVISAKAELFNFIVNKNDSIDSCFVYEFKTSIKKEKLLFEKNGKATGLCIDKKGLQTAFLYSSDTAAEKKYTLVYKIENTDFQTLVDTISSNFQRNWGASENQTPYFSDEGNLLYFGIAKFPRPEPKDTLLAEEKVSVDVWNWKDKRIQPEQLANLSKDKKETYISVFNTKTKQILQLEDSLIKVTINKKIEPTYYLASAFLPYFEQTSWDMSYYADYYLINAINGDRKAVTQKKSWNTYISPKGKYTAFWDTEKENWFIIDNNNLKINNLTKNIDDIFFNEEQDTPSPTQSNGFVGWSEDEKYVLINSQFDIWQFGTENENIATNLTQGQGKLTNTEFRYRKLDLESAYMPKDKILLHTINKENLAEGFKILELKNMKLRSLIEKNKSFSAPIKAENSNKLIWTQSDFSEFPNLRISELDFTSEIQISDANPQQKNINWGSIGLVYWSDFRGDTLRGMICKPENFDENKKYPVIMYFYEKYSDRLHTYWQPSPSRSTINFPFYTSNEYIIFIPDVNYTVGLPGKDAFNSIVSGAQHISLLPYVDKTKIGIQGQSWGGYQVAYLITQTNMFACAMGGAVVSNMTSAYGGIRWKSGLSRMFQYEQTQSRIGGTLWDKRDKYIENSPIFFADRVETPLLLMHNDADGSVPWYQGIEYFMALRRLQKPVWLLNYNGDDHNLTLWPNRLDLNTRMFQFFEFYLKGAEEPKWMKDGIPALKKGKEFGF